VVDGKEAASAIKDFLLKDGPEKVFFFWQVTYKELPCCVSFVAAICIPPGESNTVAAAR
jgi:hypothetical protein